MKELAQSNIILSMFRVHVSYNLPTCQVTCKKNDLIHNKGEGGMGRESRGYDFLHKGKVDHYGRSLRR